MKKSVKLVAIILVLCVLLCSCSKKQDYTTGLDEKGFFEGVTALDLVDVKNMDAIELSQKEVDDVINELCEAYPVYTKTDLTRAITETDSVNIDYIGSINGETFDGGSTEGKGSDVEISNSSFIPGFLSQLVGHKPGEQFTIDVTFPEDYGNEELNGKEAQFLITINYISEKTIPEFNDDFVKTNSYYFMYLYYYQGISVSCAQDYIDYLKDYQISKYVFTNCTMKEGAEVPASVQEWVNRITLYSLKQYAEQSQGVELITYLKSAYSVSSEEEFLEKQADTLKENAETSIIIQALAEYYKLEVTEEFLKDYFDDDDEDTISYETAVKNYGLAYLKQYFVQDIVMDHVKELVVFK